MTTTKNPLGNFFSHHFWAKLLNLRQMSFANYSLKNLFFFIWLVILFTFVSKRNKILKKSCKRETLTPSMCANNSIVYKNWTKVSVQIQWKSPVQETLNLSMCVDGITNTKTDRHRQKGKGGGDNKYHLSHVMCHMSNVTLPVLCATCHLSTDTNPNSHSRSPLPANSPSIYSMLI